MPFLTKRTRTNGKVRYRLEEKYKDSNGKWKNKVLKEYGTDEETAKKELEEYEAKQH